MKQKQKKEKKTRLNKKTDIPKQPPFRILRNIFRLVGKAFRLSPGYTILTFFESTLNGLINAARTYFTFLLLNNISTEDFTLQGALRLILILAALWAGTSIVTETINQILSKIGSEKLLLRVHEELFKKAQTMDVACFDNPVFFNDYVWAMEQGGHKVLGAMEDTCRLWRDLITAGSLSALAFTIDPLIVVLIALSVILLFFIQTAVNRLNYRLEQKKTPLWRRKSYTSRVFSQPEYAKEMRMGKIADVYINEVLKANEEDFKLTAPANLKRMLLWRGNHLFAIVVQLAIIVMMLNRLMIGEILLGAFVASTMVVFNVTGRINNVIWWITKFNDTSLYAEKYFVFLDTENHVVSGDTDVPTFDTLSLRDVSFTYDFSDQPVYEYKREEDKKENPEPYMALRHVNMDLHRGEKIAIVGYNGAGKTTLIKLLMRLYDPTEGQILYNGEDIRNFKLKNYRDKIGVVFQDFALFAATVAENVMNGGYDPEKDEATVRDALHATGFDEKLASLDKGLDTVLTREFDDEGTNLSGGEAQKVAIARVFAKPFELVVMDEPSAALDPIAEYQLNQSIRHYAADKTVIFISHRLSTTRLADRIYMFAGGELVEQGSHDELMAQNGKYAEMFNLQSENYLKENAGNACNAGQG